MNDFLPDENASYLVQLGDMHWYGMPFNLVTNCIAAGASVLESRLRGRFKMVYEAQAVDASGQR